MDSLLPLWSGLSLGTNGFVGRSSNEVEKTSSGGLVPISESAITGDRCEAGLLQLFLYLPFSSFLDKATTCFSVPYKPRFYLHMWV